MVCGAAGSRATQPVTVAPIATRSIAAAVNGTRIAKGLPGSANGAEFGDDTDPARNMSAATAETTSRTSSTAMSLSASGSSSTTSRPNEPSTWASATPGILRTGSSTMAACSCQRGNGSSGSRSKCTRRPLRQRTGGVIPLGDSLWEPRTPIARPVVCTTDCTTGPVSSSTGLASVCTAAAALPGKRAPARTVCATPLVTPPRTVATPGIFTESPFNYRYRA
ncbi:Uncharacterised protein [Mycobacterium tuberculosis]|nr:Uncharacterised protein [Mycobacterium tuberculosis]CNV30547.1 Uncharacterised protein [Mycobacterium tuberculosis]CNV41525.1 Uncharacterised protein [Mycobacterium tuberculosis]